MRAHTCVTVKACYRSAKKRQSFVYNTNLYASTTARSFLKCNVRLIVPLACNSKWEIVHSARNTNVIATSPLGDTLLLHCRETRIILTHKTTPNYRTNYLTGFCFQCSAAWKIQNRCALVPVLIKRGAEGRVNSHTTAEFATNSHGNAAGGVDRSALTMLGGPLRTYIGLQTVFRTRTSPLPRSGWMDDGQINRCLFIGNATCFSKFTRRAIRAV